MADNIIVKDANGTNQTMRTSDVGGVNTPHHIVQVGGAAVGSSNPFPTVTDATSPEVLSLANIDADIGALDSSAAPADGTGNYSVVAALKRSLLNGATLLSRIPVLGAALSAASIPVVIASDQTVPVQNVGMSIVTLTPLSAVGTLFSVETANFRTAVVQLTGTWVGTVTWEVSNNNADWVAGVAFQPGNTGSVAPASTATANGVYVIPTSARYVRARVSTYTSGTVNGAVVLRDEPTRALGVNVGGGSVGLTGTLPAIVGQAAHDAVIAGNPVRLAGRAVSANYAAVATGDVADLVTTLVGALIGKPFSIPELDWQNSQALTTTTPAAARTAGAAGIRNYVTGAQFSNSGASAVDVIILDGTTEIWRATVGPNGFVNAVFQTPLRGTAATALNVNLSAAGTVRANVQGYQAP